MSQLDLDAFNNDNNIIPCHCARYGHTFLNNERGHILTGNLKIIKNNKLRKLFSKGPKFREPQEIDFDAAKGIVTEEIETFIKTLSNTKRLAPVVFDNWKFSLLDLVNKKVEKYSPSIKQNKSKSIFQDPDAKIELNKLQQHFVIVPIDKAANNISFICKQHYAQVIAAELKYSSTNHIPSEDDTYEYDSTKSSIDVVNSHKLTLSNLDLPLKEDMECLPSMYWMPKMHKTPVGERFIIASPKCSAKPLLKDVTSILKLFQKQVESFHDKNRLWVGVSNFWVIQNNKPVVDRINKINSKKKAVSIRTFDFSTLYTKIPHDLLKKALFEIVDFVFKGGISKGVYVTDRGAFWKMPSKGHRMYSKQSIKAVFDFVIDNAFFQVGSKMFRQIIGIPMGSDPAPFIANLFLYVYENRYMEKLKKSDLARAKNLRHVFRFIDDLISINDKDEFLRSFKDIYPPEMVLKVENQLNTESSYLDLDLKVENRIFNSRLYDKRDAFHFSVVRMPYKCSNMPYKMFYSTISAEVLRICRATSNYSFFLDSAKKLISRMSKQGADAVGIKKVVTKMMCRQLQPFEKFDIPLKQIASDIS